MRVTHEIEITPTSVVLNGHPIATSGLRDANGTITGEKMLVELYREYVNDYPKFFKMDTLSRLGFMAAELLLQAEGAERFVPREDRAVILANRSASIKNDKDYLKTISEGNYYPSPALFVYTLPNIVTGEIAIRNKYLGETAFYVLDKPEQLTPIIETTLNATPQTSAIAGWCECSDANSFYAKLQIIWKN